MTTLEQAPRHPKVTVVLTSYNHGPFLREAIDSVLNQTFQDWECLIWDDVSNDDSWDIIQSYDDPRIIPIRNEQTRRYIYAINTSITDRARGEYIAVHHSDDAWAPKKLERQVAYLDAHPKTAAVFSHVQIIDEDNNQLDNDWFSQPNKTRQEWLNSLFFNVNCLCHPSVLSRKSIYSEVGLYKLFHGQTDDAEMWTRLLKKAEIYIVPERLTLHRVSTVGATVSSDTPQTRARLRFEWFEQKRNYLSFSAAELLEIFPDMEKWQAKSGQSDPHFMLAMYAIYQGRSQNTALFGLDLLYTLLNTPERVDQIAAQHDFSYLDFIKLSGREELFFHTDMQIQTPSLRVILGRRSPEWLRKLARPFLK